VTQAPDAAAQRSQEAPDAPPDACIACAAPLTGEYCAACGEQRPRPDDLTLRHAVTEAFDLFDSRAARTLRALVTRPGRLTADYAAGRRRAWLTPFQTFIIANIVFFAAAGLRLPVVTLAMPLDLHVHFSPYQAYAQTQVRDALGLADAPWGDVLASAGYQRLRLVFDNSVRQAANSLVVILVPLVALVLALLRVRRREPAGQHVAFALHYLAFALLFFVLVSLILGLVRSILGPGLLDGDGPIIPAVVLAALAVYLFRAIRTAYHTRWPAALVQGAILALVFLPLVTLFRFVLFMLVLHTL
jgi:hypothetical protein